MKRSYIAGLGIVALIVTVPFVGQMPGVANWIQSGVNAQNIQKQPLIQLRLDAEKQVVTQDQKGKQSKTWQALKGQVTVQPGDVLRYSVSGENTSDRAVKNLVVNQPIPQAMVYKLKSAKASSEAKISYSIDGGKNFVENPTIEVTLPNGKVETQPAPATAYTHVRWKFDQSVAAKTTVKGIYEVQVR